MITEVVMPALGETMNEGRLVRWLKRQGDPVKKGEPIFEIETDKATIEVDALASGVLRQIAEGEGATVPVGRVVAYLAGSMDEPIPGTMVSPGLSEEGMEVKETLPIHSSAQAPRRAHRIILSPRAKRLADQQNLDVNLLVGLGTGPGGRIVEADVKRFLTERQLTLPPPVQVPSVPSVPSIPSVPEVPAPATATADMTIPLAGIRKAIAERMSRSARTVPHITFDADIDMSGAEDWRAKANAFRQAKGQSSISLTALIVKVCGWALRRHRWMNASLHDDLITLHGEVHIGVAVALAEGLIVPVVHDVPHRGVAEIADEIKELSERARGNRLRADDLSGGTFTVSNLGMFGVDRFTAILNPPEAGILAVGRIVKRLVPGPDDTPVVRPVMTVTLSADHRIVDGAVAARFLAAVRAGLEDPSLLII